MIEFFIKSTVAMGALLGLYYILFEREKMHSFNRFYLLSALVFSLALPFITIITYIKEIKVMPAQIVTTATPVIATTTAGEQIDYLFYSGAIMYCIVTLIMIVRFIKNVAHFTMRISANLNVQMGSATLVLVDEKILPHTFLNYIFVNREEHLACKIQNELYTHEHTHVKQKHTLDILFIEVLKTIFWFNPLLYFYKKAIQLNHEFLADEKVIDTTANTVYYQNLLLEKAVVGTTFSMASNLTFSLTKKRFLMMTKTTSTLKANLLKSTAIPVVTALMMLLCTETVAQQTIAYNTANEEKLKEAYRNTQFTFTEKQGKTIEKDYKDLTPAEKKDLPVNPTIKTDLMEFRYVPEEELATKRVAEKKTANVASSEDRVYTMDEVSFPPKYKDGPLSFFQYIANNFSLPKELKDKPNVIMSFSFVIEKDGSISNITVTEDGGYGTAEQISKVIKECEKWTPAMRENEVVRSVISTSMPYNSH